MNYDEKIIVRLTRETREALAAAAEDEGRTPSGYVRWTLVQHLQKRGYLKVESKKRPKR